MSIMSSIPEHLLDSAIIYSTPSLESVPDNVLLPTIMLTLRAANDEGTGED